MRPDEDIFWGGNPSEENKKGWKALQFSLWGLRYRSAMPRRPLEGPFAAPVVSPYASPPPPDLKTTRQPLNGEGSEVNEESVVGFSLLHDEIEKFVDEEQLNEKEVVLCEEVRGVIEDTCMELLGERAVVRPFGSHASGMSSRESDLDLVILNVLRVRSTGFTVRQRAQAVKTLCAVAKRLVDKRELRLSGLQVSDLVGGTATSQCEPL